MISIMHCIGSVTIAGVAFAALGTGSSSARATTSALSTLPRVSAISNGRTTQHVHHHKAKDHKRTHHKGHQVPPATTESCFGIHNVCFTLPKSYTNTVNTQGATPSVFTYARVENPAGKDILDYAEYGGYMGHCDPNPSPYTWDVIADTPVTAPKLAVHPGEYLYAVKLVYSRDGGVHYSPQEFLMSGSLALGTHVGMICGPGYSVYNSATGMFTSINTPWDSVQFSHNDAVAALDGADLSSAWKIITTIH